MRYMACFLTLALGGYLNSIILAQDVTSNIKSFDADRKKMSKPRIRMIKKISDLINLHSAAKQFSRAAIILRNEANIHRAFSHFRIIGSFSRLYATTITALFAGSCIAICLAMLMIKVELVECSGFYCGFQKQFYLLNVLDFPFLVT